MISARIISGLSRRLSRILRCLPDRFNLRLLRIPVVKWAAITVLSAKWNEDRTKFDFEGRGRVVKRGPSSLEVRSGPPTSGPPFEILHGRNESLAGRRVAVMAHHDPHQIVDPYVTHYLRHLKDLGYDLVLATSGASPAAELENLLTAVVVRRGPGYDFTSWRAALEAFPGLAETEELLLCNDSVFAPIGSFLPVHQRMESVPCDFWGLCESRERISHLQSYYLVFRPAAIASPAFRNFWRSLRAENRKEAVAAELKLTAELVGRGLRPGAYIPSECLPLNVANPMHWFWKPLVKWFDFPCLKRNLLQGGLSWVDARGWREVLADKGYDVSLIDSYQARTGRSSVSAPAGPGAA